MAEKRNMKDNIFLLMLIDDLINEVDKTEEILIINHTIN